MDTQEYDRYNQKIYKSYVFSSIYLYCRGLTEFNELSAELQPIWLWTNFQTWGKGKDWEKGGETPSHLHEADDLQGLQ